MQLDLFKAAPTELDLLRDEIRGLKDSQDKLRRALFARHGDMSKLFLNLLDRVYTLEHKEKIVNINDFLGQKAK